MGRKCMWTGVYPAVTTKFTEALEVDLDATRRALRALTKDGVDGLVVLGTCGENNSLEPHEKRAVLDAATEVADGRLPIVAGVSEFSGARATDFARDAQAVGADALMLFPAVNLSNEEELFEHFRQIVAATSLPIMLCSNPPACRAGISLRLLDRLASMPNIVAIEVSAPDSRRFADIIGAFGDRYALMVGRDDVALEGLRLGAKGWVSGLASVLPKEAKAFVREFAAGKHEEARSIYRWFLPLLHLAAGPDRIQAIKLAEEIMGKGSERVRMPRLPLCGVRRAEVIAIVENAIANHPERSLSDAA